jgi:ssDNA-binding Zn-finger/Zn-ribbon topoisomerase 1
MSKDSLSKVIDYLSNSRLMLREKVKERLKEIVSSSATRDLDLYHPLEVKINEQDGEVEIYSSKEVIGTVENEKSQIGFQEAIKIKHDAAVGDILYVRVQPDLVKNLLPGIIRELFTGIREEHPRKAKNEKTYREVAPMEKSFDFRPDLEMAKVSTKNVKREISPTDILCEQCGSRMVKRWKKEGYFLACSSYPKCHYTREVQENGSNQVDVSSPCEKCGSSMVIKTGPSGQFLSCSNYPICNFTREIDGQKINNYPVTEAHRIRDLPHIPDLPERGTSVSMYVEEFKKTSDMDGYEGETPDLISILVDEVGNDQKGAPSPVVPSDELEPNCEQVLLEIERTLVQHDYLQVRKKLNELHVEVALSNRSFTTVFHVYNQMITTKALLPFVKDAAPDLLELCGQADFISCIGKVSQRGEHFYIIKSNCSLGGISRKGLWQMVLQPILEASKAIEIIEGYLKNDDFRD